MKFLVWRASKELGTFSEDDFRTHIFQGSILPTDVYSADGISCKPVSEYRKKIPPLPPPVPQLLSRPTVTLPPPPLSAPLPIQRAEKKIHFALNGAGALIIALLCPLVWKPLFLLSPGLVIAAFVMAIVAIVKGRTLKGAVLIAACPIVMYGAFVWFTLPGDIVSETRKQMRERQP